MGLALAKGMMGISRKRAEEGLMLLFCVDDNIDMGREEKAKW